MSKEKTNKYYLEENFNCAETILLLSIEEYELPVKKDLVRILKGFGGGMYKERTCGVVTGGIAVLSLLYDGEHLKKQSYQVPRFSPETLSIIGLRQNQDESPGK